MLKRIIIKGLMLATAISANINIYSVSAATKDNLSEKESVYIVDVKNKAGLNKIINNYSDDIVKTYSEESDGEDENIVTVSLTDLELNELSEKTYVNNIENDYMVDGLSENESKIFADSSSESESNQWNLEAINATNANAAAIENTEKPEKVKVALMDSVVSATEYIDVYKRINLIPEQENVEALFDDVSGHGTGMASIIAGNDIKGIKGIAPNVELYSIKVLDENNEAPVSRIIQGIYKCIEEKVDIINMSFGTVNKSEALEKAIKAAKDAGILMIASAGNRGDSDRAIEYPAAYDDVLAVGATNSSAIVSSISSVGDELDVYAPGEDIAVLDFLDKVQMIDGTSASAAEVTAVASVLWEKDKTKSADFIKDIIIESSNNNLGTLENGGLVDLEYALKIYDSFSENYNGFIRDKGEYSNNSPIVTYTDEQVKARWAKNIHTGVIDSSSADFSDTAKNVIKQGLLFPDTRRFDKVNGHWRNLNGNDNYMADYLYLIRLARETYLNGMSSAKKYTKYPAKNLSALSKMEYNEGYDRKSRIDEYFYFITKKDKWNEALCCKDYKSLSVTDRNHRQGQFIFGMAIHTAMDAFAHRSKVDGYEYDGKTTDQKTLTGNNYSNKTKSDFALRYKVAKAVADGAIKQWKTDHNFGIQQFHKSNIYTDGTFRMAKFADCAKATEIEKYNQYKSYFVNRNSSIEPKQKPKN